jgi:salicylate hydroxylase
VTPNSSKILKRWGVPERLWTLAAEPTSLIVHRYTGKVLAMEDDFNQKIRAKYGAPFVDLYRVDMQQCMYERAQELGVVFKLGEKVDYIDFDLPEITCESGVTQKADLIIAADGLWSKCRNCFLGTNDQPLPTGDLAYRVLLKLEDIEDPELRLWVKYPSVHFWIGPGAHAVGYSLRGGSMYNIVLLVPDDLPEGVSKQRGSIEEMKALFKNWDPVLNRFLDLVDHVDKWKLMHSRSNHTSAQHFHWLTCSCRRRAPILGK